MVHPNTGTTSGAWHWTERGAPSQLIWRDVAIPVAQPGEVVVRNRAIGLNPVDWKFIEWGPEIWRPGQIPGADGAGEVVAVGEDVSGDWLGQRVAYHQSLARAGSFATHTTVQARALMRIPAGMSYASAASLPCPALTAWQAVAKVPAQPGSMALVAGAGGAVGTVLVQLAARAGWNVVAMCDERHWARLRALGAGECIPYTAAARGNCRRFDAVFDTISGEHAAALAPLIAANGHLVCVQDRATSSPVPPFTTAISLHEVALNAMHEFASDRQWRALTRAGELMMQDVLDSVLHPVSISTGPLRELPDLLTMLRDHSSPDRPVALDD